VKALLRVDDKKELSNPPRIQEKEFKDTRASPALNIFAIGFPAMIIGGLLVTLVALPAIFQRIETMWMGAFDQVTQLLRIQ